MFSKMFVGDQTSQDKIQQGCKSLRARNNKEVKLFEHSRLNKCSTLFHEMLNAFDWGISAKNKEPVRKLKAWSYKRVSHLLRSH